MLYQLSYARGVGADCTRARFQATVIPAAR